MRKPFKILIVIVGILLLTSKLLGLPTENPKPKDIFVTETEITVNNKKSRVFDIRQTDGTFGYWGKKGQWFDVVVHNQTKVPLVLHWHGIIDPNPDDGVPFVTQLPIPPGGSYHYKFLLKQAGTYWFHSHYKLQEQKLMAAPLILHDPQAPQEKEAVMFIEDFTFEDPARIYAHLRKEIQQSAAPMKMEEHQNHSEEPMKNNSPDQIAGPEMEGMKMDMSKPMAMPMSDLTDVKFDAYLTNHRTLSNPDIVRVAPKETIRLRIINASASSNYFIDLGSLTGTLIAVDGEPIKPVTGKRFQIAIGNRLDIRVTIPQKGHFPILAQPEGTKQQTGFFLSTENTPPPQLSQTTNTINEALNDQQEKAFHAAQSLPKRKVDVRLTYSLDGDMQTYRWALNGQEWPNVTPYVIKPGQRVALVFKNNSGMSHPMHFHGHVFQIVELNGKPVEGRLGDTVNVMPKQSVTVVFDADNPGIWMLHCHILYHQEGGMMTTINYQNYPDKFTLEQRMEGMNLYH